LEKFTGPPELPIFDIIEHFILDWTLLLLVEPRISCDRLHQINHRDILEGPLDSTRILWQLHFTWWNVVVRVSDKFLPLVSRGKFFVK
jgi:hypothetical protein